MTRLPSPLVDFIVLGHLAPRVRWLVAFRFLPSDRHDCALTACRPIFGVDPIGSPVSKVIAISCPAPALHDAASSTDWDTSAR